MNRCIHHEHTIPHGFGKYIAEVIIFHVFVLDMVSIRMNTSNTLNVHVHQDERVHVHQDERAMSI